MEMNGIPFIPKNHTTLTGTVPYAEGQVQVNGEVCAMRGKKLRPGDSVTLDGKTWKVASDGA